MKNINLLILTLICLGAFSLSAAEKRSMPKGLVAHYTFDTTIAGGWTPCKINTNNNAKISGTRWAQGWNKAAYSLRPVSSITIPDGKHFKKSRFTLAMHIKTYKVEDASRIIFDKGRSQGYTLRVLGSAYSGAADKGKLCFEIQGKRCFSDRPINDSAWYNVILAIDDKYVRMYIDGVLQKKPAMLKKAFAAVDADLIVGIKQEQKVAQKKKRGERVGFEGFVDELMIFNRALSPQEVADAFYCSIPHYNPKQVRGRMRDLDSLLERKLITKDFHTRKLKELSVEE